MDYGLINDRAPHIVADLCEIRGFFEDTEVSRSDVEKYLSDYGGHGLIADLERSNLDSAGTHERYQALSEEVFRHLYYRSTAFGTYYPFLIQGDILVPVSEITHYHKIYAALLAFSRLKMFSHADRTRFARCFEELCVQAALGFADSWDVVHFGTNGRDRGQFGNKLKDALTRLSVVLREFPIQHEIKAISDNNVGDAGIDIVIFRKWSDPARGVPCYFGQCTAQQSTWPEKKFEASALNLERYFHFFHKPGVILFIPLCYRDLDGTWISSEGHQTILVDRKRLVDLIDARLKRAEDEEQILKEIPKPFDLGGAVDTQYLR